MKKIMALILALTLCLGVAVALTACGNNDDGTIEITDMGSGGEGINRKDSKVS